MKSLCVNNFREFIEKQREIETVSLKANCFKYSVNTPQLHHLCMYRNRINLNCMYLYNLKFVFIFLTTWDKFLIKEIVKVAG